ncbi:MAG: hypothetical protein R3E39_18930 [Anaerolineae bacterium]
MRIYPDFTWEWIIESCKQFCNDIQNSVSPKILSAWSKDYIQSAQGLITIIPKLREHPQLENLVPMKSLLSLRWFPAEDYEVGLYCVENKVKYEVSVTKGWMDIESIEKKVVSLDEAADTVYAYITKYRQD